METLPASQTLPGTPPGGVPGDPVTSLRAAWCVSGLTQEAYAVALGTSVARLTVYLTGRAEPSELFLARAERVGRGLARARAAGLLSAPATVAAVRGAADRVAAWLVLLRACDDLRAALVGTTGQLGQLGQGGDLVGSWLAAPLSCGDDELDLLLRTLVRREFDAVGLAPPAWATRSGAGGRR